MSKNMRTLDSYMQVWRCACAGAIHGANKTPNRPSQCMCPRAVWRAFSRRCNHGSPSTTLWHQTRHSRRPWEYRATRCSIARSGLNPNSVLALQGLDCEQRFLQLCQPFCEMLWPQLYLLMGDGLSIGIHYGCNNKTSRIHGSMYSIRFVHGLNYVFEMQTLMGR